MGWDDPPQVEGRGLYRALTAYRAKLALAAGHPFVRVDTAPDSRPILTRLGLHQVTTTTPCVFDPRGSSVRVRPAIGTKGHHQLTPPLSTIPNIAMTASPAHIATQATIESQVGGDGRILGGVLEAAEDGDETHGDRTSTAHHTGLVAHHAPDKGSEWRPNPLSAKEIDDRDHRGHRDLALKTPAPLEPLSRYMVAVATGVVGGAGV